MSVKSIVTVPVGSGRASRSSDLLIFDLVYLIPKERTDHIVIGIAKIIEHIILYYPKPVQGCQIPLGGDQKVLVKLMIQLAFAPSISRRFCHGVDNNVQYIPG